MILNIAVVEDSADRVGGHSSPFLVCKSGIPQGSVLGPILFNIYTSPLSSICSSHGISQQQYADATQLFIALAPSSISVEISKLTLCLTSLHSWFSHNGLALNADKSESILLGTRQRSHSYRDVTSVNVADAIVPLTDHVKLLGVTLDSHLTFDKHVNVLTKTCFYHIRAFRHIHPTITEDMAKLVACSLVGSRLDYANSALYGASKLNIRRLQRIQNIVARVVVGSATYVRWELPLHFAGFIGYRSSGEYNIGLQRLRLKLVRRPHQTICAT